MGLSVGNFWIDGAIEAHCGGKVFDEYLFPIASAGWKMAVELMECGS